MESATTAALPAAAAQPDESVGVQESKAKLETRPDSRNATSAPPEGQRRSARNAAAAAAAASAHDNKADDEEDDRPLLPNTVTLLFTTRAPERPTFDVAPLTLPVTLQQSIETPQYRLLTEADLPPTRARIQPGQQTDFSDAYYAKKHASGELLEKKAKRQERDRLVQERLHLRKEVERLKSEIASAAFYAEASPVKGVRTSDSHGGQAPGNSKKKALQEAEETLRRYDELLEPRQSLANGHGGNRGSASTSASSSWSAGGKGIPPPPDGVSPHEFLSQPRSNGVSGSAAVAQRKVAAGNTRSRSASPASFYGSGLPSHQHQSGDLPGRAGRGMPAIAPRPADDKGVGPSNLQYRRDGPAGRSLRKPLSLALHGSPHLQSSSVSGSASPNGLRRRKRRRGKNNSSDDDDGRKEAVAAMEESAEFMTEHDLYITQYNSALGRPAALSGAEFSQDDDTDNERIARRRPMTKAEREAYWDYKGPPTITDSFFRASNQAAAAGFSPFQAAASSSASALAESPKQKALKGAYAFGHKLPEAQLSAQKEFDITPLLDKPAPATSGLAVPQSAPPTITVQREASAALDPLPPHTATGLAPRRPPRAAASYSRATTPNPATAKGLANVSRNPRQFRNKAVAPAASTSRASLARQAIMTAANAAFDSDGELSSVSSSASDTEAQDSDTKWRLQRATKLLEPKDVSFPAGLSAALSPSLAAAEGKAAALNGNLLLSAPADRRGARSRSGTPEPVLTGPITISMGGIKTRRRPQLSEYPTNELQDIDEEDMRILRQTYVALTQARKKAETFGAKFKENPLGEWQVKMEESNVRGA